MTPHPTPVAQGWPGFREVSGQGPPVDAAAIDLINIIDAVEVPIVVVAADLTISNFNKAACEVLGLEPSDVGRGALELPILVGVPRLERHVSEVIADGVVTRFDLHEGDRWFVVRIAPNDGGLRQATAAVLTFTNVTAFRASVDQAVYERECAKVILNTFAEPLVVLSDDHRIQSGNRAFYGMFGVSRDETLGVPLDELGDGAFERAELRSQLAAMVSNDPASQPLEVEGVATAEGQRTLILDARPLAFPGHAERRTLVTFQDVTARKQAEAAKDFRSEEELRRSEAFLAEGQRLSLTGSFSWKVVTNELTWSEELYRIYGFDVGVPVSLRMIRARVHPEDLSLFEKMVEEARNGTNDFEWQYRLVMPDGSIKHLHAVARATRDQDGRLEYIAAVQDVTARRMSEEALETARSELAKVASSMSLGVLTASIAHEVNQPLSGIVTNAGTCLRMLDASPPDLEGARETVRRTLRDGNRAADMITRLRALFSKGDLTLESLDLNELAREVIALSVGDLRRHRVHVKTQLADALPTITGDRIQLEQVILNLVRNAAEAMAHVHDRPRQLVIGTELEDTDRVRVYVRDSGVGVDPANVTKLLDAFFTTKSDGMGIGLSVSRSIVEGHHGRLWAEPNDGPGATFAFSIPTHPTSVPEVGSP